MTAFVLNRVYNQNPGRGSLIFAEDGRLFFFFRLARCITAGCRGLVPRPICKIYGCWSKTYFIYNVYKKCIAVIFNNIVQLHIPFYISLRIVL
jgi:hypothetical protein